MVSDLLSFSSWSAQSVLPGLVLAEASPNSHLQRSRLFSAKYRVVVAVKYGNTGLSVRGLRGGSPPKDATIMGEMVIKQWNLWQFKGRTSYFHTDPIWKSQHLYMVSLFFWSPKDGLLQCHFCWRRVTHWLREGPSLEVNGWPSQTAFRGVGRRNLGTPKGRSCHVMSCYFRAAVAQSQLFQV